MIKLAVFDLDGTLLNTIPDLHAAMDHALVKVGRERITADQARAYIGNGIRKFAERALGSEDKELTDTTVSYFKEYYGLHKTEGTYIYPGISEMTDRLSSDGVRLAVLSNKYDKAAKEIVEYYFPHRFEFIFGESEICKRKPDPSGLLHICDISGVPRSETVMIGDSAPDHEVAVKAGVTPVSVTWGYRSKASLEEEGASVFADTPEELYEIIKSL